jgi:predicted ATPase/DNA-binding NarL/FixJ family response regulator
MPGRCSGEERASALQPPNNIPEELTSFVGRSDELSRVRELLGEVRLLTLVGAGGCGKTRLAIQSAIHAADGFQDGIWWVELAAVEDAELLAAGVGRALGLRERPDQLPLDVLGEHLRDLRTLVVLDNCEHMLSSCASLVDTLLRSCPRLVVLATSREALRVPGELTYRVPSLELPPTGGSAAQIASSDAAQLFVDRASQVRPGFAVSNDNAPAVVTICRALDGIPLAIELAAARVRMLSPDQIAEALDDRLRLLTGGARTVALRQQTLRASIDWSHDLCTEGERMMLRRLSVPAGGWTLQGAEAVSVDGEAVKRHEVLDHLTGLVDKSLVEIEERSGQIRYRMLETIRQYGAERLAEAGETDTAHARHLAWCVETAERAEPELMGHDGGKWLGRLDLEIANLRAAIDWAAAHDADAGLRLVSALTFFWLARGRLVEGAGSLARALEGAPGPSAVRGKARWAIAYLSLYRARFDTCSEHAQLALADGQSVDDRGVMARALVALGTILSLKSPLSGRAELERGLALAREVNDEWCTADATRRLAASYMRQSEHDLARPLLDEGYRQALALGYWYQCAWYLDMRAIAELEHGRLHAARQLAEEAVAIANEIGEPVTMGLATSVLVECDVLRGAPEEGRTRAEPYGEYMHRSGARAAEGWMQGALAMADVAEGAPDVAQARIEVILPLIKVAAAYDQVTQVRRPLAVALLLSGDLDGADGEAQGLLRHARMGQNEHVEVIARDLLGRVALARGAVVEAEMHFHDALAVAARRDFRLHTLNLLESLARVALLTDSAAEAARLLAAVRTGREASDAVRWPPAPEEWESVEQAVRTALGDDVFAASWAEGLALPLAEAVSYATRARGKRKRPSSGWDSLTPTELDVVRHVTAGLTNPQIAERMFIARATVKAHLSHIFDKLQIASRSELAADATRRDLDALRDGGPAPDLSTW